MAQSLLQVFMPAVDYTQEGAVCKQPRKESLLTHPANWACSQGPGSQVQHQLLWPAGLVQSHASYHQCQHPRITTLPTHISTYGWCRTVADGAYCWHAAPKPKPFDYDNCCTLLQNQNHQQNTHTQAYININGTAGAREEA